MRTGYKDEPLSYPEVLSRAAFLMSTPLVNCDFCDSENDIFHSRVFEGPYSFLAHMSRRLTGELIVYPWSGVRRRPSSVVRPSYVVRRSQCSNIFFSETARPIKAKFYVEPPWVGGTKFCSRHLGHMTKMADTPIYGKNPSKIFFSRTGRRISTKLGM